VRGLIAAPGLEANEASFASALVGAIPGGPVQQHSAGEFPTKLGHFLLMRDDVWRSEENISPNWTR
jgi:hypothetical protein